MKKNKATDLLTEEDILPRNVKERITTFVDQDVLEWLKAEATQKRVKYQSLLNSILREAVEKKEMPSRPLEQRVEFLEALLKTGWVKKESTSRQYRPEMAQRKANPRARQSTAKKA